MPCGLEPGRGLTLGLGGEEAACALLCQSHSPFDNGHRKAGAWDVPRTEAARALPAQDSLPFQGRQAPRAAAWASVAWMSSLRRGSAPEAVGPAEPWGLRRPWARMGRPPPAFLPGHAWPQAALAQSPPSCAGPAAHAFIRCSQ